MKIILAPAKKMNTNTDLLAYKDIPVFIEKTKEIMKSLQEKDAVKLREIWKCNEKIAEQNIERLSGMDLYKNLTPAVLCYEGIAYQYMAPVVFENKHFEYVQEHLRILSAFYGVLKPMDGVTPYRLEMQAKLSVAGKDNMYDFWGENIYNEVRDEDGIVINLASKEYSKCVSKYLKKDDRFIDIVFCEKSGDKLITKGTYAKMARGEMVRYMAEEKITEPDRMKNFDRLGYIFREDLSGENNFVFERIKSSVIF